MKNVLLIGADGMLGGELFERLSSYKDKYTVYGTTLKTLDICDKDAVLKKVEEVKPYYIINCAAYTNVDACEVHTDVAEKVNGVAVGNIAEAAKQNDATFIQISTDYVFDGNLDVNKAYTEDMTPNPVSAYGRTKLLGEENAKKAEKYYILRTAWLYGRGKNFARTMINVAKTHDNVTVVCDQHGSPTSTTTLCKIIEAVMEKEPEYGIYHSTNEGFTTWYDYTKTIYELKGIKTTVTPVTSKEYQAQHPESTDRPFNSQLSKEKLHSIGIYPENYIDALKEYLKEEE